MGIMDEIKASFGDDFFSRPSATPATRHHWQRLCVCGHHIGFHSTTVGGEYRLPPDGTRTAGGKTFTTVHLFTGCAGALPPRGADTEAADVNHETMVATATVIPTCPCTEMRPVAEVDRPNRYFNQRIPVNLDDRARHPFLLGLRAFSTFLAGRKAADPERGGDPAWADRELARRFTWIDGARVCSMSKCKATDDVWPMFVDGDRSELRCPKHR